MEEKLNPKEFLINDYGAIEPLLVWEKVNGRSEEKFSPKSFFLKEYLLNIGSCLRCCDDENASLGVVFGTFSCGCLWTLLGLGSWFLIPNYIFPGKEGKKESMFYVAKELYRRNESSVETITKVMKYLDKCDKTL